MQRREVTRDTQLMTIEGGVVGLMVKHLTHHLKICSLNSPGPLDCSPGQK